ncbi:hypothetical protein GYMLUDRAFT_34333 [Collybiopsis luxurians FD-317 M1]|nr:hypothetical protein GYMLUDRAFT_34333 [Collybiopsis luxurians FD-317 M1]
MAYFHRRFTIFEHGDITYEALQYLAFVLFWILVILIVIAAMIFFVPRCFSNPAFENRRTTRNYALHLLSPSQPPEFSKDLEAA